MLELLFDHNEKCAGSTVLRYMQRKYENDVFLSGISTWHSLEYCPKNVRAIGGHDTYYLIETMKPAVSATVLRDPVERVISLYLFSKQESIIPQSWAVKDFINQGFGAINFYAYKYSGLPPHLLSRCPLLAIERSVAALKKFTHVGFNDRISKTIEALGLGDGSEIVANVTKFTESISEADREIVRINNLLDMEIYKQLRTEFE